MTAPRIVFRADASHAIGFGHVARLSAVIEEVARTGAEPIAMFGGDAAVAAWTRSQGLAAHVRPAARPWTTDEVIAAAARPHVRAAVIDGPALVAELVPALAERQVRTVVIDDRGDCRLALDAVVNHNFHAPGLAATYPAARRCLLGRDYLMLRRAIRRYPHGACRPPGARRLRLVISFGGSDPVGATARTLDLLPTDRPCDVLVITGPSFRDDHAVDAAATSAIAAGHAVELIRDPADPAGLFVTADAAICSAGGTLGELAFLGCPALGFAIVADQVITARAQAEAGLITGGQRWSTLSDDALRLQLQAFLHDERSRHDQRQRALTTADGLGAHRIVAEALS
jgi:spore coat polysaccharide biosynthesis predicted glycosyltransferase SpsG